MARGDPRQSDPPFHDADVWLQKFHVACRGHVSREIRGLRQQVQWCTIEALKAGGYTLYKPERPQPECVQLPLDEMNTGIQYTVTFGSDNKEHAQKSRSTHVEGQDPGRPFGDTNVEVLEADCTCVVGDGARR